MHSSKAPKPRRDLGQLRRLLAYTRPYRTELIVAIIATLIGSAFGLLFPLVIGRLVDASFLRIGSADTTVLDRTVLILIGVFALQAFFSAVQSYLLSRVGEGVVADLRRTVYRHLLTLSPRFFETRKTGEITSRLTSDISTVQGVVSSALVQIFSQTLTLVGTVIILFVTNWRLSLLMLSIVPVVVLAAFYFGRLLRKVSKEFQDRVADANARAEEAIGGIRVVQAFTAEPLEARTYADLIGASFKVALRRARIRAIFNPVVFFAMFSAIGIVLWYGGRLVIAGELTPGQLVAFLVYTFSVAGAVGAFSGLFSQFQEALGASSRIFELLDEKSDLPEPANPVKLSSVRGEVRFEHVSFGYGERGAVLEDVSLTAKPGEVVALVGPSGAGKSTLISLIPRFYDPTRGRILLDGVDIRDLTLHDLRSNIALVPQETQLFSGTIAENIRYGKPGASDAEVIEVAKAANAHEFITSFPDGYATIVGERGIKLSGGQRQRVAIARALLKNPRILILDEATSSLDSESEALVQEALEVLMQGRTTFVIAHRLSTIRGADKIVVLEAGRIVQQGTHQELLAAGGLYKELYELQFREDVELPRA
ncbi:ABC transporter ATP-binding protein [Allomeiothermus silvanus]|uniref:ABC transporter ATP-binding protein n=1 Tax=Allomeiothermus silvanus TaxID=52022 RepID=UPI0023F018EA|nr:ABC transporter transmembrane domain-containing protein [Allomeiothermus silvanus]